MAERTLERLRSFFRMRTSFRALLGMFLILEVWATLPLYVQDPDVWWHLAVGQRILRTHVWPTHDIYSFTAHGNPWIAYEWLGDVVIALAAQSGAALAGLAWLRVGLGASLVLLVCYYAYLRCRNFTAAFLACTLIYWLSFGFFTLRPQLLGYIFLVITLIFMERFRLRQQKTLWLLPVVFLFWVNTHGTFVLGLGVIGVYWLGGLRKWQIGNLETSVWTLQERRHLAVVSLLCVLAMLLTPYGSRLAAYPFQMAFLQPYVFSHIAEWQPIGFGGAWSRSALVLVLLSFLGILLYRSKWHLEEVVFLFLAFFEACVHRRMFLIFAIVFAPILATMLARWIPDLSRQIPRSFLNSLLLAVLAICMVMFFPSHKQFQQSVNQIYPTKTIQYLRSHQVPGPMFNEYQWGGFLIWKLGLSHRVFIDGRAGLYEHAGVFADYMRMVQLSPQTLFLLRKYSIRSCLLTRNDPLGNVLAMLPNWHKVYSNKLSILFVRNPDSSSTYLIRHRKSTVLQEPPGQDVAHSYPQLEKSAE